MEEEKKVPEMTPSENKKKKRSKGWLLALLLLLVLGAGLYYFKPWETPQIPTADPPGTEQETTDVGDSAAAGEDPKTEPQKEESGKKEDPAEEPETEDPETAKPEDPSEKPAQPEPQPTHTHTWVHHDAVTHTVHHDAVTHTVHHDTTYKTVHHDAETTQKYVVDSPAVWQDTHHCECGASFSSDAELGAHQDQYDVGTGHDRSWVTTDLVKEEVGHYETVIVKDAWDETVVDQAAWDETVVDQAAWDETIVDQAAYDECSGCGARK